MTAAICSWVNVSSVHAHRCYKMDVIKMYNLMGDDELSLLAAHLFREENDANVQ